MKYMILIYGNEQEWATMPPEAQQQAYQSFMDYNVALSNAGIMRGGGSLQPSMTATTVQVRDGKTLTTDGPFAETREQLGGFYIIDVETLDDAIEWAAKCPAAYGGSIEVRPMELTEGM